MTLHTGVAAASQLMKLIAVPNCPPLQPFAQTHSLHEKPYSTHSSVTKESIA